MTRKLGTYSGIFSGGLTFLFLSRREEGGGAHHPLGTENPLKSIDFTGPGESLASPP